MTCSNGSMMGEGGSPSAAAISAPMRGATETSANGTNQTDSWNAPLRRFPTSSAKRLFPTPGEPVTVNGPAPTGGSIIKFTSNRSSAIPPTQNTIPAGGTVASFGITTLAVTSSTTATITAAYNGSSLNADLTITP